VDKLRICPLPACAGACQTFTAAAFWTRLPHQLQPVCAVKFEIGNELVFLAIAAQLSGVVIILFGLRQYDLGRFSGTTQLFRRDNVSVDDEEPLHITGMHRYVRHPLYLGAYLYLLGGAVSEFGMQTAFWGCLYLFIGTWFEERSLVSQYGRAYVEYKEKVPAIIPFKGRAID